MELEQLCSEGTAARERREPVHDRLVRTQIGNRQRAAIGTDDIFYSGTYHFGHWTLYTTQDHEPHSSLPHLKIA